jgi:hypothetical protein
VVVDSALKGVLPLFSPSDPARVLTPPPAPAPLNPPLPNRTPTR